jgi:hypothetical protein
VGETAGESLAEADTLEALEEFPSSEEVARDSYSLLS